jgi:hypothetical protein
MDATVAAAPSGSLTTSFEKLFLSSVRLSSAATLFGVAQLETAVSGWQDGTGFGPQMNRFGNTVESLTQCLMQEVSPGKKEALDSLAEITSNMVRQSFEGMSAFDPRQAVRLATRLAQRSSDALAGWTAKPQPPAEEEPQLAADVLAS